MIKEDISNIGKYSIKKISAICDDCGTEKILKMKLYTSYGYKDGEYLCRSCKMKKNNREKWGVENVFQLDKVKNKIKKTNKEKWGVENPSQSNEIRKKIKNTNKKKYGYDHHLKNKDILKKQKKTNKKRWSVENVSTLKEIKNRKIKTSLKNNGYKYIFLDDNFKKKLALKNLKKYGHECILKSDIIKDKIKKTNKEKYGFENPSKNKNVSNKIKNSVIKTKHNKILENKNILSINSEERIFTMVCNNCNKNYDITYFLFYKRRETNTEICTLCNPIDQHQSGKESKVFNFIKKIYDGNIIRNHRLNNRELDIYLPDINIAFEINGIYWHSEIFKNKNYHKSKTDMCSKNNIELFHIWEDDIDYKFDILKSMIKNKIGLSHTKIGARRCVIKEVNKYDADNFLNKNHIQGKSNYSIRLGLYYKDKLLSVMTFKKNKNYYDLNRFCNKLNLIVMGGASKMLNYFINKYSNKIVTFSDLSYSNGNLYEKIGFKKEYHIKPDYRFVKEGIRIHKFNFRKKDTSSLYKIYDCGKIKYKYNLKV